MKLRKRLVSLVLAFGMLASCLPTAFAEENPPQQNLTQSDQKAAAPTEGTCGEHVTWKLAGGTLTISGEGEMTDYDYSTRVPWNDSHDAITKVVVESGVTTIGEYAFYGCRNLTQVSLPDGLTCIGQYAFQSVSSLTEIKIPSSVNEIKASAFRSCSSISSVDIPDGVTIINDSTFYGCSNLRNVTIPDSVVTISGSAFRDCTALAGISIPNSVVNIGSYAFEDCTSLKEVEIPDSVRNIYNNAFDGCINLQKIRLSEQLSEISKCVLKGCSSLKEITIPDNVTTINKFAFESCTKLEKVIVGKNVNSVYGEGTSSPFYGCDNLSEIYFTGDVPNLEDYVFNGITATAYYPRNISGWDETIQNQYGGTITWTPWTPGETPEQTNNLITINDTWKQKNFSEKIPDYMYEKMFGVIQAAVIKKQYGKGGNCYGMVSTAINTWHKLPNVSTYNSGYQHLNQVKLEDRSKKTDLTARQYIMYGQLTQRLPSRRLERNQNKDNLQGLHDAVKNYVYKGGDAISIDIHGNTWSISGSHELLALNIEDTDDSSIIKVYDCNDPGKECELHLNKDKNGNFTGWYYDMGFAWIGRWSDSNGSISYSTQDKNLYRDLTRRGIIKENYANAQSVAAQDDADAEYPYLITANTDSITVKDGKYTIKTNGTESDNTDILLPIGNGVSPVPDQEEAPDKKDVYNAFWAKTNQAVTFSDIQDDSDITVAGSKEGVTASVPANATVSVDVPADSNAEQKVQVSSSANETVGIEYFGEKNSELASVTVAGTSSGEVTSSMKDNAINISGVKDLNITDTNGDVTSVDDLNDKTSYQITEEQNGLSVKQDSDGDGKYETDIVKPKPDTKPTTPVTEIFSDIYPSAWYIDYVQFVYDNGLMTGTSKTTFAPEVTLSRAMVAQVLYNYDKRVDSPYRATNGKTFKDVSKNDWFYEAIQWASANGIASGVGNGYFEPNSPVTREQVAQFLYNYNGRPSVSGNLPFSDADKVSGWAKNAMLWAYQNKIINGTTSPDGGLLLDPQGGATRAQAAAILTNYMKNMM